MLYSGPHYVETLQNKKSIQIILAYIIVSNVVEILHSNMCLVKLLCVVEVLCASAGDIINLSSAKGRVPSEDWTFSFLSTLSCLLLLLCLVMSPLYPRQYTCVPMYYNVCHRT